MEYRVIRTLLSTLLITGMMGCGQAQSSLSGDLFERLRSGVFVEYGGIYRLGDSRALGEMPEKAIWAALPISPRSGWLPPTRRGWHPIGDRAVLVHLDWWRRPVERPTLRLDLQRGPDADGPQRVRVELDGSPVGEAELVRGLNELAFPVSEAAFEGPTTIALLFEPELVRQGFKSPPFMLVSFGLVDGAVSEDVAAATSEVFDDAERRLVRVAGSGMLVTPLDVPPGGTDLALELRCPDGPANVRIAALNRSGVERVESDLLPCGGRWEEMSISLQPLTGPTNTLSIEVLATSKADFLEVRRARIVGGDRTAAADPDWIEADRAASRTASQPQGGRPPDVLLIVLDAARAGHFGFAGYARDTTPKLDQLARESLVFERAYAECPNTSCSIPNLITGVPFMNLGTVFQGKRLPDEVTTLAEYLKPLGYRTVGLSANPNNAVSRNSHQGFDRFEKVSGALRQAEMAAEIIARQAADEPLYLQLHFLPPHQPYMPTDTFNVFTDPTYEGVVHPKLGLRSYSAGLIDFSAEDVAQLVALYDGNLLMADAAVDLVLEAMKRTGRWDNTLVVLTSDHGEAFGEHDTYQHNSTVFDEMLHVPFVLRLPRGEVPSGVETARPVALADVVPTILGYLGVVPQPEVWGIDLLAPQPSGVAERFLFHRTYHSNRPLLAIRDRAWKAVTGQGLRKPQLFDLLADPKEQTNLASQRPDQFSGLALRLRDFLVAWEARVPRSTQDVELSSEEIEQLRALGYVE